MSKCVELHQMMFVEVLMILNLKLFLKASIVVCPSSGQVYFYCYLLQSALVKITSVRGLTPERSNRVKIKLPQNVVKC